ncbi:MAG: protein kinase domain-containing protein [Myxococcales bacterium]
MAMDTELGGYAIVDRIAVGGMAEVYRARAQAATQRGADEPPEVVLKRLLPNFRAEQAYINLFVEEGKLCVRLKHPNVVRTYKLFKKATDYFMVQELVDGTSLAVVAERARQRGQPLPLPAALSIAQGVLKALEYVHRIRYAENAPPIIHCDVNPANVLIGATGEVKITDFGVALAEGTPARGEGGPGGFPRLFNSYVMHDGGRSGRVPERGGGDADGRHRTEPAASVREQPCV